MFIKSDIRKVTIALEKTLGHEVYMRLGQEGIIHLARVQTADALTDAGISAEETRTRDVLTGSNFVLSALKIEPGEAVVAEDLYNTERDAPFVSNARRIMERVLRLRERIQEELVIIAEQSEYAEALSKMGVDPKTMKKARLTKMVFGQFASPALDLPSGAPFIMASAGRYVFGAALPQDAPQMLQFLNEKGFTDKTSALKGTSLEDLKRRGDSLKRRLGILDSYSDYLKNEIEEDLKRIYHSYKNHEEVLKAMRLSGFSNTAIFITGWMDANDRGKLNTILKELCGERFIVSDERDPNAPVRLRNIRLFKPFELIIKMMGMPANSEIDPTPLAGITFVIIFGLMFGDLGQGLVLAVTGLVLKYFAKKKASEDLGHAGGIVLACGLSAAICGVLYGNLFSSEHLIPALWIRPVESIMLLFSVTILMGVVIIIIGLFLNIINAFINADYAEALFEKRGLAIVILYSALIIMAVRFLTLHRAPESWQIVVFIILPIAVFSLRGVLGPSLFNSHKPHDTAEYITETIMDIVEIALSMFANTISFIRVGAFALSHSGLSIVTYTLAGMADPALKSPGAIAVIVIGNIFIIGFEGMICGIQSMRLEYYEFFSKFYKGDGVAFSPFTLKVKTSEV